MNAFDGNLAYGACVQCGCYVRRNPILPEELKRFYSYDDYWVKRQKLLGSPPIERRSELYRSDGRLAYWLSLVERLGPPKGRVIEIAAAPGVLLEELAKCGYDCIGVEGDEKVSAWLRKTTGVDVRAGFFPEIKLPSCDLLLGFDVLEHTPTPLEFLQEVGRLLVAGGVAILQAPVECRDYQNPFAAHPEWFDTVAHLFLFTDRSIRELAWRASLEVIALEESPLGLGCICVFKKP